RLVTEVQARLTNKEWRRGVSGMLILLQYYPRGFGTCAHQACSRVLFRILRTIFGPARAFTRSLLPSAVVGRLRDWRSRYTNGLRVGRFHFGSLRCATPISREFGLDRALPIARYYTELFLAAHADAVGAHVLEMGDKIYPRRFGGDRVTK